MEFWLPVRGYEGLYQVSNLGRVRSLREIRGGMNRRRTTPRVLTQHTRGRYPFVSLSREGRGRSCSTHVLVADAFLGPRPDGMVTRHLDGNASNPTLLNLAYGTQGENEADKIAHGTRLCGEQASGARLSNALVHDILAEYRPGSLTCGAPALARRYGVHAATVRCVIVGITWRHIDRSAYPNIRLAPEKPPKRKRKCVHAICRACGVPFTSRSHRPDPKSCSKACTSALISLSNRLKSRSPIECGPLFVAEEA